MHVAWKIDNSLGIGGKNAAYKLYVNGNSLFNGNIYCADTNYYLNTSGDARLRNIYGNIGSNYITIDVGSHTEHFEVWGMKIEETVKDFEFIESLPGRKLLIKGNHDLWWNTSKKIHDFFDKNNFKTIDIIFNNCAVLGKYAVAGTRGWISEGGEDDKKIIIREAGRLEASLKAASGTGLEIIVFLHYPPVYADSVCQEIFGIIKKYGVKRVYYGHIHGRGAVNTVHEYDGVKMRLVSCDCVDFTPVLIG